MMQHFHILIAGENNVAKPWDEKVIELFKKHAIISQI